MTRRQNTAPLPETMIQEYKERIESLKEPKTYTDRILLRIYQQMLDEHEKGKR